LADRRDGFLQDNLPIHHPLEDDEERVVEPRVSLVTLGVSDLERAVAFYREGLGWPKSDLGDDEVAFFKTGGVVLVRFPRTSFAVNTGVNIDDVEHGGFARFWLAHNVAEEEGVDSVLAQAAQAGATIVREAQEIFFGRHGFFADPDGFLWEVDFEVGSGRLFLKCGPGPRLWPSGLRCSSL
jgi:catechol 2,3-dioxygenase-like lactoylglutathione lyase family enzyme